MSYRFPIHDSDTSSTSDTASFTDTFERATTTTTMNPDHDATLLAVREMMREQAAEFQQQLLQLTRERDLARDAAAAVSARPDALMADHETPASTPVLKRPKPKLPELFKFSGKRSEYYTWSLQAKSKIRKDGEAIGTPEDQCDYLYAQLQPTAQQMVAVYYDRGTATGMTGPEFLAHLDALYIDPNAAKRALVKLTSTPQRENEPFAEYLPKFEGLLQESGVEGDLNRIAYLEGNINDQLNNALVGTCVPRTYPDFVAYLLMTASQLEASRLRTLHRLKPQSAAASRAHATAPVRPYAPAASRNPDAMDWTPTVMGMSALKSLTDRERDHLRRNNGCFRCRKINAGHLARDCPNSRVPTRAAAIPSRSRDTGGQTDEQLSENGEL